MDKKRITKDDQQDATQADIWLTHAATDDAKRAWLNTPSKMVTGHAARQRVSIRKPIACHILVRVGASHVIAEKVHDISLTGAFLEMDPAGLAMGDFVEVVIGFVYDQRQIEHLITAEIMRIEPEGVGLKFGAYDNRTYTDLVNLLYTK
jgi:hypothetical protein